MKSTKAYLKYRRLYGPHFTKELCEFAASLMEDANGPITPYTKEQIDQKLKTANITLEYNKLHDAVFVANMCKADYLGKSVPNDDQHLCMYIRDVIDDPDGYDGQPFIRWMADIEETETPIDWSEFV